MAENPLVEMLTDNVNKWNKLVAEIEKDKGKLIQGEDKLFDNLRDFWKKNDFAPDKCKQLLNEIAIYKNKHPASDLKENLQEFRGLCNSYYTKDKIIFEAFQKAMGGKKLPAPKPKPKPSPKSEMPKPQPSPKPQPNPKPKPSPKPSPKPEMPKPSPINEQQNQAEQNSGEWFMKLLPIAILCAIVIAVIISIIK